MLVGQSIGKMEIFTTMRAKTFPKFIIISVNFGCVCACVCDREREREREREGERDGEREKRIVTIMVTPDMTSQA